MKPMRLKAVLRETWRNVATGTSRCALIWLLLSICAVACMCADLTQMTGLIGDARKWKESGASTYAITLQRNRRRGLRRAAFRERSVGRRRPPAVVRPRAHRVITRDRDSDIRGKRTCRAGIRGDRDTEGQFRCDHVDGCGAHVWRACRHGAAARRWRTHACFRDVRLAKRRKATNIRLCDYLARQRYQGL